MNYDIHDISDDLLVKFLLGECTPEEALQVEQWLHADPKNMAEYHQFKHIWTESKTLAATSEWNEEEAWERMKGRMIKPQMHIKRLWYYAAAAVVLMAVFFLFKNRQTTPTSTVLHQDSLHHNTPQDSPAQN